tara:strand:- start:982 stop:1914 length:933 start_codon:yes stop_codon:yes gene_type:complete
MAETLAQLKAKLKRYEVSGIMSKSKIDGVKKQIADKEKQQQKQAKTGVSDAQKQRQLKVPAKPPRSSAINPNSNTSGKTVAQRRKERKNKPFFKGENITFSQAQRDKLEGGVGKGSSVIKNILTKIDNAKTLEAENKQRQRFAKLFGVSAPNSTKTYEKVEQTSAKMPKLTGSDKKVKKLASVSSVDEMGGKGNNTGVGPDASAPAIKKDPPKKTKAKATPIVDDDKKAKNKPKRSVVKDSDRLGIKIARMLGDERSSSQMVKDRIENEKLEDEMNFRKGGMAFGKGGMYKTPKKAYGMRYGGVTRKLKG